MILLVIVLAVIKLVVSNRFATFGQRLTQIDQEKTGLKKQKILLEEEIYQLTSLEKIKEGARELGFEQAREVVYYGRDVPVALR